MASCNPMDANVSLVPVVSMFVVQGDSVARGPKLLSVKNYVIEIMT